MNKYKQIEKFKVWKSLIEGKQVFAAVFYSSVLGFGLTTLNKLSLDLLYDLITEENNEVVYFEEV